MTLDEITTPARCHRGDEHQVVTPSEGEGEAVTLDEAKPRGPMNAEQWRRHSERRAKVARDKQREATRHTQKMADLRARAAKV